MKSKIIPALLTLGLVAASSVGGAWLGSKFFEPAPYSHQRFHAQLYSELKLTPAQRAAMDALEKQHAVEMKELRAALSKANRALADRLSQDTHYTVGVNIAIENVHAAMLEIQKASVRHLYNMRNILNDRQKKVFDRHVADTMEEYANQAVN